MHFTYVTKEALLNVNNSVMSAENFIGSLLRCLGATVVLGIFPVTWATAEDGRLSSESSDKDMEEVVSRAAAVRPSPRQIAWHEREVEALIHFGVNTITGREWGTGSESPSIFNPSDVDVGQWVRAAQSVGAQGVILVAKHHDGFCLWPSSHTEHSVKNSPWRGGKGDLVAEMSKACSEAGMAFGVYLSPSDLNHPMFGRRSEIYNDYFCDQLTELLTNYGPISQVFFDGANPPGRQQRYDFQRYYGVIRELQPNAVISIRGPDVRWIGNETAVGRDNEWSVVPLPVGVEKFDWPNMIRKDIGSRDRLANAESLHWYPAVATVPMHRNRWFWNIENERRLLGVDELFQGYVKTVGRNASLLLNLCPDNTGRIPEYDVRRLHEFGEKLREEFAVDHTMEAGALQGETKDPETGFPLYWINLAGARSLRWLVLEEPVEYGQKIESFEVWGRSAGNWKQLHKGPAIGRKRILELNSAIQIERIEVRIQQARGSVHLNMAIF